MRASGCSILMENELCILLIRGSLFLFFFFSNRKMLSLVFFRCVIFLFSIQKACSFFFFWFSSKLVLFLCNYKLYLVSVTLCWVKSISFFFLCFLQKCSACFTPKLSPSPTLSRQQMQINGFLYRCLSHFFFLLLWTNTLDGEKKIW